MTCRWIEDASPGVLSGPPPHVRWLGAPGGMLGAIPYIIKKWFPERNDAEWTGLDEADQNTLLMQANAVEAQWNGKIGEMRANGACDATKPGLLAGAMREYLIKSGGNLANMDDLGSKSFGPKDCAEWVKVFGKAPDEDTVAKGIGLATGGTSPWVKNNANGYTLQITLKTVCPNGFKLPTCAVAEPGAGGGAPPPPPCDASNPCPPDQDCFKGDCLPKCGSGLMRDQQTGGCVTAPKKKSALAILGVFLLASAAVGLIYYNVRGTAGLSPVT